MKISKKQLIKTILREFKDTFKTQSKEINSEELEVLLDKQNINIEDINIDIAAAQEYLIKKMEATK